MNDSMTTTAGPRADLSALILTALRPVTRYHRAEGVELTGTTTPIGVTTTQLAAIARAAGEHDNGLGCVAEHIFRVTRVVALAQVRRSDGSGFLVAADRYGTVRPCGGGTVRALAGEIAAMHAT
jgi:hypothetical protein